MSSYNEWRIESNDLQTIYDASSTDMNKVFDLLYPQGSAFMQMWVKDSIMYECLGANTNMNNASSRADNAKRALLKFKDERSDNVTEIGRTENMMLYLHTEDGKTMQIIGLTDMMYGLLS